MNDTCELCQRAALEPIYKPEKSTRGLTVYLCSVCGLLQSLPRIDRAERAPPAVSAGADWGNVRYGKGFRTQIAVEALRRHGDAHLRRHAGSRLLGRELEGGGFRRSN